MLILPASLMADDKTETEVEYLLDHVASSGCTFHRNGEDHDAKGAAEHLRLKYRRGKRYVNSAEDFINRLASKSSWSGDPYTISCEGVTEPSKTWLHQALQQYRSGTAETEARL
jgi:hypothetical protein